MLQDTTSVSPFPIASENQHKKRKITIFFFLPHCHFDRLPFRISDCSPQAFLLHWEVCHIWHQVCLQGTIQNNIQKARNRSPYPLIYFCQSPLLIEGLGLRKIRFIASSHISDSRASSVLKLSAVLSTLIPSTEISLPQPQYIGEICIPADCPCLILEVCLQSNEEKMKLGT